MTLRELRYLVALANRAHFGRAAEDCHVSQPTLSTQIRKLEEYLGLALIERNAKSFAFTPIGQDMVEKARRIVTEVDALLSSARTPQRPLTGPLNLGVIPTLAPYLLPRLLPLVKSHYQQLQLRCRGTAGFWRQAAAARGTLRRSVRRIAGQSERIERPPHR